ncbi:hypothetical protein BCR35DRAFT_285177 [Leucosporidium creatinivorum]|uniref:Fe2OG dioxygenase domain-containing protein n=1 Tax=Leucosporidium creatinivorum TaxID=106004 RepID=A0A1Y2CJ67_9BASI|nr:hypothetical protein BCR35DRAFT_285177 [Leucosporidium creatinivorum]
MLKPRLPTLARCYSKLTTAPHPALHILPAFLAPSAQQLLLTASLALLAAPSRSTSHARKIARQWKKANPSWTPEHGFMSAEAYEWEEGHFDGVIEGYREMLVRAEMYDSANQDLVSVLQELYRLLPPSEDAPSPSPSPPTAAVDPPAHLLMHLLHLAPHGEIRPHVDNKEAFGRTIVGLSLGGERVMRFRRAEGEGEAADAPQEGPEEFEVLLRPGDVYVQSEPLRTHYTHEVLKTSQWEGREVGGTQRLSIMLRDKLPLAESSTNVGFGMGTGGMGSS